MSNVAEKWDAIVLERAASERLRQEFLATVTEALLAGDQSFVPRGLLAYIKAIEDRQVRVDTRVFTLASIEDDLSRHVPQGERAAFAASLMVEIVNTQATRAHDEGQPFDYRLNIDIVPSLTSFRMKGQPRVEGLFAVDYFRGQLRIFEAVCHRKDGKVTFDPWVELEPSLMEQVRQNHENKHPEQGKVVKDKRLLN